jgi:hypothetical protein
MSRTVKFSLIVEAKEAYSDDEESEAGDGGGIVWLADHSKR